MQSIDLPFTYPRSRTRLALIALGIAVAVVCAMSLPSGAASAASLSTSKSPLVRIERIIDQAPASASLSAGEERELAESLYDVARQIQAHRTAPSGALVDGTTVTPDWHIGVGWYIYFHHLTPADQRWFMEVGVGVVAAAICAASGGAVCAVAAIAAAVIIPTISEYYTPKYCLEVQLTWTGQLHKVYPEKC